MNESDDGDLFKHVALITACSPYRVLSGLRDMQPRYSRITTGCSCVRKGVGFQKTTSSLALQLNR